MGFEWDKQKERVNKAKHGISFDTAIKVFDDPFLMTLSDSSAEDETRWLSIGSVDGVVVLLVVYTLRDRHGNEIIRIISARKLSKGEVKKYGYHS